MKILFASHRFEHMGKFSGYARLDYYLKENKNINLISYRVKHWNWFQQNVFNRKLFSTYDSNRYGPFHYFERCLTEYDVIRQSNQTGVDVIHLAYLEDYLGYMADNRDKVKAKIIATAHQPPEWWKMTNKNTSILKCLDALIVLSSESKIYFEQFLPGKVFFIPHGIDTNFFSPSSELRTPDKKKRFLFVGNWMRDYKTLEEIIILVNKKNYDIEFNIVSPRKMDFLHPLFSLEKLPNIIWHRNINDQSLLEIYRNMDVLLLPLNASTSNNSLLEAAVCEVPVITNKCGGVTDYLNEDWAYLTEKSSPEQFLEKIDFVIQPSNAEKVKSNAKLQQSFVVSNFSWEKISSQMVKLYKSL
ncbi:MAG: glycosyltransferase family 4 protein [Bacteroidia bacterium]